MFAVLAIMLFPMVQKWYHLYTEYKLSGDIILENDINFSTQDWFNGTYSQSKEKYLNDNFGFRNFFVKLNNQFYYFIFKKANAKGVVVGRNGFLYELKYLKTHAGLDYVGDKEVKTLFSKLKLIQDTLEKKGIHFALLFAPGKTTFYPEYIPSPYDVPSEKTNYLKYIEAAKNINIHFIDFNQLFAQLKSSEKYPLYPKTGTHWSTYGMYLAFDTLSRYIESLSAKKLSKVDYSNVKVSDSLIHPDGDIANGMNLFFDLPHFKMAYPIVKWDTIGYYKPRVLTVSDSYWMGLYFLDLPKNSFSKHEFWYYNKQLFNYDTEGKIGNPADFDLKKSVEKNNFVFIMSTEASLKEIGWGFIDEVYTMYKNGLDGYEIMKQTRKKNSEATQIKLSIRNNEDWFNEIKHQAKERSISVDSSLQLNVEYVYSENHKNDSPTQKTKEELFNEKVTALKVAIRKDKKWLSDITQKAKEKHISIDSCINLDAKWMAEQEMKNTQQELFDEKVTALKAAIKKDKKWLNDVAQKAKEKHVSLDSCINLDAKWMAEQEMKKK